MTTTTPKADRFSNRAPKGGAVSPVNNQFYKGGQFMPMLSTPAEVKPVALEGSSRQVAWANRIRTVALASLNDEIQARLLFLNGPKTDASVRTAIKALLITRHGLMTERSAAKVIERREALA